MNEKMRRTSGTKVLAVNKIFSNLLYNCLSITCKLQHSQHSLSIVIEDSSSFHRFFFFMLAHRFVGRRHWIINLNTNQMFLSSYVMKFISSLIMGHDRCTWACFTKESNIWIIPVAFYLRCIRPMC